MNLKTHELKNLNTKNQFRFPYSPKLFLILPATKQYGNESHRR